MAIQPIKKSGPYQKPRSKTVKRRAKAVVTPKKKTATKRSHPKYGTSKLEKRFENNFLKKLGVKYERQFYAKDIKRYYDFKVEQGILVEVDGTYYHAYGKLYEDMSPMQKHNHRVDMIKNEWAAMHGYRLVRIWEHEINNNPTKVMEMLKIILEEEGIKNNKKKRH